MTLPMDDSLYWEQKRQRWESQKQNLRDIGEDIQDDVTDVLRPEETYQQSLFDIDTISQKADQYTQTSVEKKRQEEERRQQELFQQQQLEAMQSIQDQQVAFQKEQREKYQELFKQQQEALSAQWQEYNQQSALWNSGINTQVINFKPGNMAQIAQLARNAGFPESQIPAAVAIAMAESGGRPDAVNHANRNGSSDYGLMQINTVHSGLLRKNRWNDPQQNMNMAYQIWKQAGEKWTPWAAYNNGSASKYLDQARVASSTPQPIQMQPFISNTSNGLRNVITESAKQYIGVPYVWGGTDLSKGVDCSGLVQQVYKQHGIKLPRTANEQAYYGVRTSISNLKKGDLVAWNSGMRGGKTYSGHIAIYMGDGKILEAQQKGVPVRIRSLTKHDNVFGVHLPNLK